MLKMPETKMAAHIAAEREKHFLRWVADADDAEYHLEQGQFDVARVRSGRNLPDAWPMILTEVQVNSEKGWRKLKKCHIFHNRDTPFTA